MVPAGNGRIDGATASGSVQQWSKLPYDLLGKIYPRLDAPLDRVRFTAVCTQWRAAVSHPHRRVLPWLFLNPCCGEGETRQVYCPQDRTVQPHLPSLHDAAGRCFVGGHEGGWIASSEAPFRIINVFSGAEVTLPGEHIVNGLERIGRDPLVLRKIIFSEEPTSSGCILAAITDKHDFAFYAVGFPEESGWTVTGFGGHDDGLADIAFCKGELYGITRYTKRLIKYELGMDQHGAPVVVNVHWLCTLGNYWEVPHEHARYIVELHGKLLMVGSNNKWWSRCLRNVCGTRFTVHELVDTDIDMDIRNGMKYKWVEVNSLGEHALFLGPTCSKAVRVPASGCGDVQRNRIYFSHHRCLSENDAIPNGAEVFSMMSNYDDRVYYYKEEEGDSADAEGIMSVGYYVMGGLHPPTWLLPHACYLDGYD